MNSVAATIQAEIQQNGPLPFARFMELALYCPGSGYYETEADTVGRRGDFYTSVSVGSLFGELLAFQFARWRDQIFSGDPARAFQIVEAGAHHGQLAGDILRWFSNHIPQMLTGLEYWIVEPSARRRELQKQSLAGFSGWVHWAESFDEFQAGIYGIIHCNELLDAMPVRRFGWNSHLREWFEWGVGWNGSRFFWTRLGPAKIADCPEELLEVLPDGFVLESSPAACEWWETAARTLRRGKLMTFDYGLDAANLFSPSRQKGTLRAYHKHQFADNILANPGQQDITAHVNFSAIQNMGESEALQTELLQSQSVFLTNLAKVTWEKDSGFGPWKAAYTRQFQTLTHPEHLGRSFKVLVQSRLT